MQQKIDYSSAPSRYNPNKGKWEPIFQERIYTNASPGFPKWACKRKCGEKPVPENYKGKRCPKCRGPLIRWMKYEEKN